MVRKLKGLIVAAALVFLLLLTTSGWFLVVDQPEKADVILVLAGETDKRPMRALELLSQGYAPRLMLDVPAGTRIYQFSQLELAQKYVQGLPNAAAITICPIAGLSTKTESADATRCIQKLGGHRVLLVTSDFHTRRALSTFRKAAPGFEYSVAAARDPQQFGTWWWRHRQWAKTNFDEWARLVWWQLVDRWH